MNPFRFVVGPGARYSILVLVGYFFLPVHAAEYYKWVDQNGVTHYSDGPPPNGVSAKRITINGVHSTSKAGTADASSDEGGEQKPDAVAAATVAFCDDLSQRLSTLNSSGRPIVEFAADGTHTHAITAEQVAVRRADLESKQREFCKSPTGPVAAATDANH